MTALVVEVGARRVALPATCVDEVIPAAALGPDGRLDVHGERIRVLDLAARLGLPERALRTSDHFVLVRAHDGRVAVRVDRASDLVELEEPVSEGLLVVHDFD